MVLGGTHISPTMHRLAKIGERAGEHHDKQQFCPEDHGGGMVLEQQQHYPQAMPVMQVQSGGVGAVPQAQPPLAGHVRGDVLGNQSYATGGGIGTGSSDGLGVQQQRSAVPHHIPSGPQENALLHGITTEIHNTAAGVGRQVDYNPELESLSPQAPFDPNLVCPMCRRQFKIGEIQKYRQHVKTCHGT